MKISGLNEVFFSPTGHTKKVIEEFTKAWDMPKTKIDLSNMNDEFNKYDIYKTDLCVFAVPSYCGRVPVPATQRIKQMKGNNTPAIIIATYGNRHYDDTLCELQDIVESRGFYVVAALAVPTEHSIASEVATGRVDSRDIAKLQVMGVKVRDHIALKEGFGPAKLKGNETYKELKSLDLKPTVTGKCANCGVCAVNCPVGAIPLNNPRETDSAMCISCMRCVTICPTSSRVMPKVKLAPIVSKLKKECKERKEIEIFLNENIGNKTQISSTSVPAMQVSPKEEEKQAVPPVKENIETDKKEKVVSEPLKDMPEMEPLKDMPVSEPLKDMPEMKPLEDMPVMEPLKDVPEMKPLEDMPVMEPLEDMPEMKPLEDMPEMKPLEDMPEMKSLEDIPEMKPLEDMPEMKPLEDIPEMKPLEDMPEMKPSDAPVMAMFDEVNVDDIPEQPVIKSQIEPIKMDMESTVEATTSINDLSQLASLFEAATANEKENEVSLDKISMDDESLKPVDNIISAIDEIKTSIDENVSPVQEKETTLEGVKEAAEPVIKSESEVAMSMFDDAFNSKPMSNMDRILNPPKQQQSLAPESPIMHSTEEGTANAMNMFSTAFNEKPMKKIITPPPMLDLDLDDFDNSKEKKNPMKNNSMNEDLLVNKESDLMMKMEEIRANPWQIKEEKKFDINDVESDADSMFNF